jgi:hypothetical protein
MRPSLLALGVALVVSACGGEARSSGLAQVGQPSPDHQTCRRDEDCTLVEDCCGCFNGGSRTAVRVDAVQALTDAAEAECGARQCAEGIESNHRSCQAVGAACRGGRCIPKL